MPRRWAGMVAAGGGGALETAVTVRSLVTGGKIAVTWEEMNQINDARMMWTKRGQHLAQKWL